MNTELIKQEAEKVKLLKRSLMALRLELPKEVADSHEKITWDAMEEYAQSLQRPGGSDGWISEAELDAMTKEKDYWYNRCYHAEQFIEKSPCDPDIYDEQIIAHQQWQESKKR
jgi:hypothetical protein